VREYATGRLVADGTYGIGVDRAEPTPVRTSPRPIVVRECLWQQPFERNEGCSEDLMAIADFERALQNTKEIDLTTTGRTSGREITQPVWFVRQGQTLYLLPVTGSDSNWYKNVLKTPAIRLTAGGTAYRARVTPITDPARVGDVVEKFRAKYGAQEVKQYYPKTDVAVEVPLA
jgi:hypothetical protein